MRPRMSSASIFTMLQLHKQQQRHTSERDLGKLHIAGKGVRTGGVVQSFLPLLRCGVLQSIKMQYCTA